MSDSIHCQIMFWGELGWEIFPCFVGCLLFGGGGGGEGECLHQPQSRSCRFACRPITVFALAVMFDSFFLLWRVLFLFQVHREQRLRLALRVTFDRSWQVEVCPFHSQLFLRLPARFLRQFSLIPQDKKTKFGILRESILSSFQVNLETLQCFMGKVVSFSSDIPGGMLYAC